MYDPGSIDDCHPLTPEQPMPVQYETWSPMTTHDHRVMEMMLFRRLLLSRHMKAPRDERASKTDEQDDVHRRPKPRR